MAGHSIGLTYECDSHTGHLRHHAYGIDVYIWEPSSTPMPEYGHLRRGQPSGNPSLVSSTPCVRKTVMSIFSKISHNLAKLRVILISQVQLSLWRTQTTLWSAKSVYNVYIYFIYVSSHFINFFYLRYISCHFDFRSLTQVLQRKTIYIQLNRVYKSSNGFGCFQFILAGRHRVGTNTLQVVNFDAVSYSSSISWTSILSTSRTDVTPPGIEVLL